jgi:hypothetical protein
MLANIFTFSIIIIKSTFLIWISIIFLSPSDEDLIIKLGTIIPQFHYIYENKYTSLIFTSIIEDVRSFF